MSNEQKTPNTQPDENLQAAEQRDKRATGLGLGQIFGSVFAAFFGVQSQENSQRDFGHGKAHTFIIAGIVLAAVFVGSVFAVVSFILS